MTEQPWKIRHIRHPLAIHDSKSGIPAMTILWRSPSPSEPIEYRVALCSAKDQFSRKKGIEVALSKESKFVEAKEESQLVDIVLDYKKNNKLRQPSIDLINWFIGSTYSLKVNYLVQSLVNSYRDKVMYLVS